MRDPKAYFVGVIRVLFRVFRVCGLPGSLIVGSFNLCLVLLSPCDGMLTLILFDPKRSCCEELVCLFVGSWLRVAVKFTYVILYQAYLLSAPFDVFNLDSCVL